MASAATDPDKIAAALIAVLTPLSTPVGGVGAFTRRTPDLPYIGALPVVEVKPVQNVNTRIAAANSTQDTGWLELTYRTAPPQQSGQSLAQIEDAYWTARAAILTAIHADPKLVGTTGEPQVSDCAAQVEELYRPDGQFAEWQNAEFVAWSLRVSYIGPKTNV